MHGVFFAVLALALLLTLPAQAACPSSISELHAGIDAGIAAYEAWEWDRFGLARADVAAIVGCLSEPLAVADAERVHLFTALQAGVDKDEGRATEAFRALLAVNVGYTLPEGLAAPGSLLQRAFDAAKVPEPLDQRRLPKGGWIVDGQAGARALPLSRPAIVQKQAESGLSTWMVAGEPLPDDLSLALAQKPKGSSGSAPKQAGAAPAADAGTDEGEGRRRAVRLGLAGGGALALSAASFALTYSTSMAHGEATTYDEEARTTRLNHAFFVGGAASGAVGLGLGVGATISLLGR